MIAMGTFLAIFVAMVSVLTVAAVVNEPSTRYQGHHRAPGKPLRGGKWR